MRELNKKSTNHIKHSFISVNIFLIKVLQILLALIVLVNFAVSYADEPGMALIPGGEFSSQTSKTPLHIDTFYIDKTEVTQKSFITIMGHANFFFKGDYHPAEQINWFKAREYCEKTGKRLPTELEWEKAAKGNVKTLFFWGNQPDASYAWFGGDYDLGHHPVGEKKPNSFGVFDTAGNVWEWTSTAQNEWNKTSSKNKIKLVAKGGAFNVSGHLIAPTSRMALNPKSRVFNVGFRCAK